MVKKCFQNKKKIIGRLLLLLLQEVWLWIRNEQKLFCQLLFVEQNNRLNKPLVVLVPSRRKCHLADCSTPVLLVFPVKSSPWS